MVTCSILLENCSIRPDVSEEAIKREGKESVMESAAVTVNTPLIATDVPEGSGSQHRYHFVLVTPGRDYTFACNTSGQRTAWMVLLMKGIEKANKDYMCCVCWTNRFQLMVIEEQYKK